MKKNVVYPEAESISLDSMKVELRKVRKELSKMHKEVQELKAFQPLIENVVETSVKIIRNKKIG